MSEKLLPSNVTRRHFLAAATGSVAAGLASGGTREATAVEALERQGAKFKFSLAAYSYRKLLQGEKPQLTLFDFVDDCAKFGLEGTELTSYYFPPAATHEYLRQLKRHCFRQGLDVSGTAVGNDFGHPPGPKRDEQLQLVRTWIENAEILRAQ